MGDVRPYTPADAPACSRVVLAAVDAMGGLNAAALRHLNEKNTPERLAAELALYHTLVYQEEGRVTGVGALDGPEIKRLYVEPGRHRRGAGRALVRQLEREARALGFDALVVDAPPLSEGFWGRMGYQRLRADTARWGQAEFPFVHMRKELSTLEVGNLSILGAEGGGG